MSTNNISDEELDDLFRKTAENLEPPFDPEAWKEMETKLDSAEAGNPNWKKWLYALLLLIGIGLVTGVYKYKQKPENGNIAGIENNLAREKQNHSSNNNATTRLSLQQEQKPAALQADTKAEAATLKKKIDTLTNGNNLIKNRNTKSDKKVKANVLKTKPVNQPRTVITTRSLATRNQAAPEAKNENPAENVTANKQEQENSSQPDVVVAAVVADAEQELKKDQQLQEATTDSTVLAQKSKSSSAFLRKAQVILLVAPDVTTVKFHHPDAISTNAGIVVGVSLTTKISLVSGVVWANKIYGADPEYYEPANDYWYGKRLPNTIDATCKVLDVPLNIRYQVLERNKNSLAVQAGISSYFMLEEKYTYNYDNYSKSYTYSNQNTHWFGVQNLSVSYNRKLTRGFTAGVEPFVKIPLTGIGAGNVKLTSAGIFFTAGYTLSLRK